MGSEVGNNKEFCDVKQMNVSKPMKKGRSAFRDQMKTPKEILAIERHIKKK